MPTTEPRRRRDRLIAVGRDRLERHPGALNALRYLWDLLALLARKFVRDECPTRAAALAYATVLGLVPLLVVSLLAFRLSAGLGVLEAQVRSWLLSLMVTDAVADVTPVLNRFLQRATSGLVGIPGAALLGIAATWLFVQAEVTLNRIWQVRGQRVRSFVTRVLSFWVLLALGPVLVGIGLYLTARFAQSPLGEALARYPALMALSGLLLPLLVSVLLLGLVYWLVPHHRVSVRAALIGAVVAGVGFEAAKRGFNLYVGLVYGGSTNTRIYGAFALLPVFLIWVYLVWVVLLFGAEVAYSVDHHPGRGEPGGDVTEGGDVLPADGSLDAGVGEGEAGSSNRRDDP